MRVEAIPPERVARRLRRLPRSRVQGRDVAVARTPFARLLGLAGLSAERAGSGLLLPRCRAVHTWGMRFPLELRFLDAEGSCLAVVGPVPPRRFVSLRAASAVLEIPCAAGGRNAP